MGLYRISIDEGVARRMGGGFALWRDAAGPPMAWRSRELAGNLDAVAAGVLLALAQ
jgi:hypothetical protein